MGRKRFNIEVNPAEKSASFLRKLQAERIMIANLYQEGNTVYFQTDQAGVAAIRRCRKPYRVKVKIRRKEEHSVQNRLFSSLLFLISLAVPFIGSLFLWQVTIDSDMPEVAERIEKKLEKANITAPSLLAKLPPEDEIRRLLMQDEPSLSWIRFQRIGTAFTVYPMQAPLVGLKEEKEQRPSHLVAKTAGVITHFALTRGERASIVHQTVEKGDMLATGILEQGEKRTVTGADGAVYADYWLEYHFELPRTIAYTVKGEEQLELRWQLPWDKKTKQLQLPVSAEKKRSDKLHTVYLEEGMEETIILPLLSYHLLSNNTEERIIKEENVLHAEFSNDKVVGTVLFLVNENIAEKRPITQGDDDIERTNHSTAYRRAE